jgi:hypothetical protein
LRRTADPSLRSGGQFEEMMSFVHAPGPDFTTASQAVIMKP